MSSTQPLFEKWYSDNFGDLLASQDPENLEVVKRLWNAMLEAVAHEFEFDLFEERSGNQVADIVRQWKEKIQ